MGLKSEQLTQSHPFNAENLLLFIIFGLAISLDLVYFFYVANSFVERIESLYIICVSIVCTITFAILIWEMLKLFELFKNFECIIEESKLYEFLSAYFKIALYMYTLLVLTGRIDQNT